MDDVGAVVVFGSCVSDFFIPVPLRNPSITSPHSVSAPCDPHNRSIIKTEKSPEDKCIAKYCRLALDVTRKIDCYSRPSTCNH